MKSTSCKAAELEVSVEGQGTDDQARAGKDPAEDCANPRHPALSIQEPEESSDSAASNSATKGEKGGASSGEIVANFPSEEEAVWVISTSSTLDQDIEKYSSEPEPEPETASTGTSSTDTPEWFLPNSDETLAANFSDDSELIEADNEDAPNRTKSRVLPSCSRDTKVSVLNCELEGKCEQKRNGLWVDTSNGETVDLQRMVDEMDNLQRPSSRTGGRKSTRKSRRHR